VGVARLTFIGLLLVLGACKKSPEAMSRSEMAQHVADNYVGMMLDFAALVRKDAIQAGRRASAQAWDREIAWLKSNRTYLQHSIEHKLTDFELRCMARIPWREVRSKGDDAREAFRRFRRNCVAASKWDGQIATYK